MHSLSFRKKRSEKNLKATRKETLFGKPFVPKGRLFVCLLIMVKDCPSERDREREREKSK